MFIDKYVTITQIFLILIRNVKHSEINISID